MSTLANTKAGDTVALIAPVSGYAGSPYLLLKKAVDRTSETHICVGNLFFLRSTGLTSAGYVPTKGRIEPWTSAHDQMLVNQEQRLQRAGMEYRLAGMNWRDVRAASPHQIIGILDADMLDEEKTA